MWLLIVIETYLSILHCNVANLGICTPSETIWHFDCTNKSWQKSTFILATMWGWSFCYCCCCWLLLLYCSISLPYNNFVNCTKWTICLRGKQWLLECIILKWYAFIVEIDFHHTQFVLYCLFSLFHHSQPLSPSLSSTKWNCKIIYDKVEPFLCLIVIMEFHSSSFEFNLPYWFHSCYCLLFNLFVCELSVCVCVLVGVCTTNSIAFLCSPDSSCLIYFPYLSLASTAYLYLYTYIFVLLFWLFYYYPLEP